MGAELEKMPVIEQICELLKRESERLYQLKRPLDLADVRDIIKPYFTASGGASVFEQWTCAFPGKMGLSWKRAWDGVGTKEEAAVGLDQRAWVGETRPTHLSCSCDP